MRRTVKTTLGVTTVAGALALGGSTAFAFFGSPSLTSTSGGTDDMTSTTAPTTTSTTDQDEQAADQMTVTDQDGTQQTISFTQPSQAGTTGAMTEEQHESTTAQKHEAEDTDQAPTTSTSTSTTSTSESRSGDR